MWQHQRCRASREHCLNYLCRLWADPGNRFFIGPTPLRWKTVCHYHPFEGSWLCVSLFAVCRQRNSKGQGSQLWGQHLNHRQWCLNESITCLLYFCKTPADTTRVQTPRITARRVYKVISWLGLYAYWSSWSRLGGIWDAAKERWTAGLGLQYRTVVGVACTSGWVYVGEIESG